MDLKIVPRINSPITSVLSFLLIPAFFFSLITVENAFAYFLGTWESTGPGPSKNIAAITTGIDSTPVVFSVNARDNSTNYKYQSAINGTWSDWISLGGSSKQIAAVSSGPDSIPVLFSINTKNNGTYYKYQFRTSGTWSDWISLGGSSKQIAAVSSGPESTPIIFSIGLYDNNIYYKYHSTASGTWSDWISLGGSSKQIAVLKNPINNVPVLFSVNAKNNSTYYKYQSATNGTWSNWISLGGASKQIAPTFDAEGNLIVFSIGIYNNNIYYKYQSAASDTWSDWISLGGSSKQIAAVKGDKTSSPILISMSPDSGVYLRYHSNQDNGTDWIPLGGESNGISVANSNNGVLQLFAIGRKTGEVFYYSIKDQPVVKDVNLRVEKIFDGNLSSSSTAATGMAFIDNDTIILLQKEDGKVRVIRNGVLMEKPLLDLNVNGIGERGLLGILVKNKTSADLQSQYNSRSTKFVFLYLTEAPTDGMDPIGNRIYRYEWNGSNLINPVLILTLPSSFENHNAGKLSLGLDGTIYSVIGDQNRTGVFQNFNNSNYTNSGIVLRFNSSGEGLEDNPFYGIGTNNITNKVFAYGIRNSFGIAIDPVTGKLWDTENGDTTYDEVNLVFPGFNSGWRSIMGPINRTDSSATNLVQLKNSRYSDPIVSWKKTIGITDIEFLNSTKLGEKYHNNIFVGDINKGNLYFFMLDGNRTNIIINNTELLDSVIEGNTQLDNILFGKGFAGITDLQTGPDGFLYVLTIDGRIFRILPQV